VIADGQVRVACNTSAGQAVAFQAIQYEKHVPVGLRNSVLTAAWGLLESPEPLNISSVAKLWFGVAAAMLKGVAPGDLPRSERRDLMEINVENAKLVY
jgi:hypothetical protein